MTPYLDLVAQIADLQKQADAALDGERSAVIDSIRTMMGKYRLTYEDLRGKTKRPLKPLYRDKVTGETWSGRGHHPKWLKAHEAAGKSAKDFLV